MSDTVDTLRLERVRMALAEDPAGHLCEAYLDADGVTIIVDAPVLVSGAVIWRAMSIGRGPGPQQVCKYHVFLEPRARSAAEARARVEACGATMPLTEDCGVRP